VQCRHRLCCAGRSAVFLEAADVGGVAGDDVAGVEDLLLWIHDDGYLLIEEERVSAV
jgi:hypothetical protein